MSAAWTFRAGSDGSATTGYVVTLHPAEREVVVALVSEVADLLGPDDAGSGPGDGARQDDAHPDDAHPFDASAWSSEPVGAPDDPALHRLFPDAYPDDPEHAAEFRRLTEGDLRTTKSARLRTLIALLGGSDGHHHDRAADPDDADPDDAEDADPDEAVQTVEVMVPSDRAPDVVAALTDLRLVMAERMGVRTADDADALTELVTRPWGPEAADPERAATRLRATLYLMLGVLQDTLLDAMAGDGPPPRLGSRP